MSCVVIIILVLCDLLVPIIGNYLGIAYTHAPLRPAYVEHTLLGCYGFLPIEQNFQATVLGITVTICHLFVLWVTTYSSQFDFYSLVKIFCLVDSEMHFNIFLKRLFQILFICVA